MPLTVTGHNPVKVTGTTSVNQQIMGGVPKVKFIYWFNPTTEGHLCTLKDVNGYDIIPMRANTENDTQMWTILTNVREIWCDDMDSGTLYIYIR